MIHSFVIISISTQIAELEMGRIYLPCTGVAKLIQTPDIAGSGFRYRFE